MDIGMLLTYDDKRKLLFARLHLSRAALIILPDDRMEMEK
jgi:hypothetical protein